MVAMKRLILSLVLLIPVITYGQQTRLTSWRPTDGVSRSRVYHPEPVLLVHGVNANDSGWTNTAIPALGTMYAGYDIPDTAIPLGGSFTNLWAIQTNYVHTFNYGDRPGTNTFNQQTFQPIMWNAWDADLHGTAETNRFHDPKVWGPFPLDSRKTLDKRIEDVRGAYVITVGGVSVEPDIVLVAHSLGAVVSHYYLLKKPSDHGVRRLVTIAGAHQGSLLANWLTWYNAYGGPTQSFDGHQVPAKVKLMRIAAPLNLPHNPLPGYFKYWNWGAVQNVIMIPRGTNVFQSPNWFLRSFWNTPAPKTEYVFNVYQMQSTSHYVTLRNLVDDVGVDEVFVRGDGFVPTRSAAGKDGTNRPSIWNGSTNVNLPPQQNLWVSSGSGSRPRL